MQTILVWEPVMAYPRRNRPYALITNTSLGDSDQKKPRGLGAILTQIDKKREHQVIAYASRKHEKNYTPYLLEMQAAIWAMEHFDTHLPGRHFKLFMVHWPLEKLGKVHTKTLNRLQEAMLTFDFEIVYKKGSECLPISCQETWLWIAFLLMKTRSEMNRCWTPDCRP